MRLQDKVIVLTGGGTGIGQSACEAFAKEGADVVIVYHSSKAGAEETAQAVEAAGRRALVLQADTADHDSMINMVRTAEKEFGRIDVLVNNAVTRNLALIDDITVESWDNAMKTNLRGMFSATQAAAPAMMERGSGVIINVSSQHGFRPSTLCRAAYASSKHGIMALTRSLAAELSPHGLYVNCLVPGSVPTKGSAATKTLDSDDSTAIMSATDLYEIGFMPTRRRGLLSEMDECMIFLANADREFLTGACLAADGGWTIID